MSTEQQPTPKFVDAQPQNNDEPRILPGGVAIEEVYQTAKTNPRTGYSLQEILTLKNPSDTHNTLQQNLMEIERFMDHSHPEFHPEIASIYAGLKPEQQTRLYETLKNVSLHTLIRKLRLDKEYGLREWGPRLTEYLGASPTDVSTGMQGITGAMGARYLIPDKIYASIFEHARMYDIAPDVSAILDAPGSYIRVDAESVTKYHPQFVSTGGESPHETLTTAQGTIYPRMFNIHPAITNEMIEDALFDVMEKHISIGAKAMGEWSTYMTLWTVMYDFDAGTAVNVVDKGHATTNFNQFATGGAYYYISDLLGTEAENAKAGWPMDYVVGPPQLPSTFFIGESNTTWWFGPDQLKVDLYANPLASLGALKVFRIYHNTTTWPIAAATAASTLANPISGLYAHANSGEWCCIGGNKTYGIQTLRKRWLKMEKYSDPIKDLAGMVLSSRQFAKVAFGDAVTVAYWHS